MLRLIALKEMTEKGYNFFEKVIGICEANIKLVSNKKEFLAFKKGVIADIETDFYKVKEVRVPSRGVDAYFYIIDEYSQPRVHISSDTIIAQGNLLELEKRAKDIRFSLLGNEGLFYRFTLKVLEDVHDIFSFHACSLFDEKKERLYIICGGAGSGKTVFLLKGIEVGLKIFSTEMTHFKFQSTGKLRFYKGSLLDNIRIGNLKYDYPKAREMLNIDLPQVKDEWGTKIVTDLSKFQVSSDHLNSPQIFLVFPHIEHEKRESIVNEIKDKRVLSKCLYDNISSKIGETILLYEKIPVVGLDTPLSAKRRLQAVNKFTQYGKLQKAVNVIAGAKNCLKGVKE